MPVQSKSNYSDLLLRTASASRIALVEPAATFTSATPSSAAAGADTLLTSAGVHGLTSAVSVGASIYVSAGTGWSVGFHAITAIAVDTTGVTIQIDTPYSASMGTPTIALAGTEVTMATIAIPPLFANSYIETDATWDFTSSTSVKTCLIRLGGTSFYSPGFLTSGQISNRGLVVIQNRGLSNSQTSSQGQGFATQAGVTSVNVTTGVVDTSVSKNLTIGVTPQAANNVMSLERYIVNVWR